MIQIDSSKTNISLDLNSTLESLLNIVKNQLYILDCINRKVDQIVGLQQMWKWQINANSTYQRFELYSKYKHLKGLLNKMKNMSENYFFHALWTSPWKIDFYFKQISQLILVLKADFFSNRITNQIIKTEIEKMNQDETSEAFKQSFNLVKKSKTLLNVLKFFLNTMMLEQEGNEVKYKCSACLFQGKQCQQLFEHIFDSHLITLFQFFDSSLSCCLDIDCSVRKNKKFNLKCQKGVYNFQKHTLQCHSYFFNKEKALRYIFLDQTPNYFEFDKSHQLQNVNSCLSETLKEISNNFGQTFEQISLNLSQIGEQRYKMYKKFLLRGIEVSNYSFILDYKSLKSFDNLALYLKLSLMKIPTNQLIDCPILNPLLKNRHENSQIFTLEFQEQILEIFSKGNILNQLKSKLLLGYFNSPLTNSEFSNFLQELDQFIFDISFVDFNLKNESPIKLNKKCIFNEILCSEQFKTTLEEFQHYYDAHFSIILCLSSNCQFEIREASLDKIIMHCHDVHKKSDVVTLIKKYLKNQKLMYMFKAVCSICKIRLNSQKDIYWKESQSFKEEDIYFQPIFKQPILWRDIFHSYDRPHLIKSDYLSNLISQFEVYSSKICAQYPNTILNNNYKIATCKKCQKSAPNLFAHLKQELFLQKTSELQIIPIAGIKAHLKRMIEGSLKMTYPELQGNISAYSIRPLILIKGTDIVLQLNQKAEIKNKFSIFNEDSKERNQIVQSCIQNRMISNHCYQIINLSKQLILQQEQILLINKTLWKRHLEKNGISNSEDQLQLEFSKIQDLMLFDDLIHRTQIYFLTQTFEELDKILLPNLIRDSLEILKSNVDIFDQSKQQEFGNQLEQVFLNNPILKKFWNLTLLLYLYCEQLEKKIICSIDCENVDSIIQLLLLPQQTNPFYYYIRRETLFQVRQLFDNEIHPLYLGVYYQQEYQNLISLFGQQKNINEEQIILNIFQVLMNQTLLICLPNHEQRKFFQKEKEFYSLKLKKYELKNKLFQLEFLKGLDDQQFIDMSIRLKLIKEAFKKTKNGEILEEKQQGDVRWTMQFAQFILSSLKQTAEEENLQNKETYLDFLKQLAPLESELNNYFNTHIPIHDQDFLNGDYRKMLIEILQGETQNQNSNSQQKFSNNYDFASKIYLMFFIPTEKKATNLLKVHQQIRSILYREPKFQLNRYFNITSFQKEIEYALFPELYPQTQGGLNAKAPLINNFQIIIDIVQAEKDKALHYQKVLKTLKKRDDLPSKKEKQQLNFDYLKSNELQLDIQLIGFSTQLMEGKFETSPSKAIFTFIDEEIVNQNQSFGYVYKFLKQNLLIYEQHRNQILEKKLDEQTLPQVIHPILQIQEGVFLEESVLEKNILSNIDKYINRRQQKWEEDKIHFAEDLKNKVMEMKSKQEDLKLINSFRMEQERLFLNQKIKEWANEYSLNKSLQQLKSIQSIDISSSGSCSEINELREEDEQSIKETKVNLLQQIDDKVNLFIENNQEVEEKIINILTKEEKNEISKQITEFMYFNRKSIDLSKDTKFRLKCSFLPQFRNHVKWIFWRYFEWRKSQLYGYQLVVNRSKGAKTGKNQENYVSLPPIGGTNSELREAYHQLSAYCFQEGLPLLFLTITLNEFDEKSFKVMRGLNFFDLSNDNLYFRAEKKTMRDPDIISQANDFVDYFLFQLECYKRVIKNSFGNSQKNPSMKYQIYKVGGLFGNCKQLVTRIEFQERGSIHAHIFLFITPQEQNEGQLEYSENYLQYLLGLFSTYNLKEQQRDKVFVQKFNLFHECSKKNCISKDTLICREGFPSELKSGFVIRSPNLDIQQRRLCEEEKKIVTFERLTVTFFNSNCQIQIVIRPRHLAYLCKYSTKLPQYLNLQDETKLKDKISEEEQAGETDEKKINQITQEYFNTKKTPLQEAYFAFKETAIFEKTFRIIKVKQQPLLQEIIHQDIDIENFQYDVDDLIQNQNLSSTWQSYLNRPSQFEQLNFVEYFRAIINYGKKAKYLKKVKEQEANLKNLSYDQIQYFIDFQGNVIKLKEKDEQVTTIQTSFIHPTSDYKGAKNYYYLQMLQLYYPHRKDTWIMQTKDSFEGFEKAFKELLNTFDYAIETQYNSFEVFIRKKYARFQSYPLRNYVNSYNDLKNYQISLLKSLYRFAFKYSDNDDEGNSKSERLVKIRVDYILQLLQNLKVLIDKENEYSKLQLLKENLDIFDPRQCQQDQIISKVNQIKDLLIQDIKDNWDGLNENTQMIIIHFCQIYKHYGSYDLINSCPISGMKFKVSQKEITRMDELGSQITQIQEEPFTQIAAHYRTILTQQEAKEAHIQKRVIDFSIFDTTSKMFEFWEILNLEQKLVLCIIVIEQFQSESQTSLFIHGPGGVGKSFLLMVIIQMLDELIQNVIVLCPTQQAIQNIKLICRNHDIKEPRMFTLHKFFKHSKENSIMHLWIEVEQFLLLNGIKNWNSTTVIYEILLRFRFKNFDYLVEQLRNLDYLLLEEVSMIDPIFFSLLDIYSQIARFSPKPFGGINVLLFGDSFQLKPVRETCSTNYFNSHVFSSSYFSHFLELCEPIRQKDDLDYFKNILQPLRMGTFHYQEDHFQFYLQKLKTRLLPQKSVFLNPQNCLILNELNRKIEAGEKVISLFFKNENAQLENMKKCKSLLKQIQSQASNYQMNWRRQVTQPIQFSFESEQKNLEQLMLLINQTHQVSDVEFEEEVSYYGHYLSLPLGLRNQLAKHCSQVVFNVASKMSNSSYNQNIFEKELLLFEQEEIVIRKNIDTKNSLINGQFCKIKELIFDLDQLNLVSLSILKNNQKEKIENQKVFSTLSKIPQSKSFQFSNQQLNDIKQLFEEHNLNNINFLMEHDILQTEKSILYEKKAIQPRLSVIKLEIPHVDHLVYLKVNQQIFSSTILISNNILRNCIERLIEIVEQGIEIFQIVQQKSQLRQKEEMFQLLRSNQLFETFYVDIMAEQFSLDVLYRAKHNLLEMCRKMPSEVTVTLHQIPLNLGYARTIHTAQGATYKNVIINLDLPKSSHGLLYTGLSRVQKLEDLFLTGQFQEEIFKGKIANSIKSFFEQHFQLASKYLENQILQQVLQLKFKDYFQEVKLNSKMLQQVLFEVAKSKKEQIKKQDEKG